MKAAEHPTFAVEQRRVERICAEMEAFVQSSTSQQSLDLVRRGEDVAKTYLVAQRRKQGLGLADQDAISNPVRGRIVVREDGRAGTEVFYLGLRGFDKDPGNRSR